MYRRFVKRALDVACALLALLVLSPVLAVVALLVRVKLGAPVLFKQERPGRNDRIFKLYKFRTMTDKRDEHGALQPDDIRLTRFGRRLRSTSLDELPELWNILKGDMSVVGPRPLLVQYLPRYNDFQRRRHEVRPGLTGLAQVKGRNALSWDSKFAFDVEYVDRVSFPLDVKIIFGTVGKVFSRSGVSGTGQATMTEFMGNGDGSE